MATLGFDNGRAIEGPPRQVRHVKPFFHTGGSFGYEFSADSIDAPDFIVTGSTDKVQSSYDAGELLGASFTFRP